MIDSWRDLFTAPYHTGIILVVVVDFLYCLVCLREILLHRQNQNMEEIQGGQPTTLPPPCRAPALSIIPPSHPSSFPPFISTSVYISPSCLPYLPLPSMPVHHTSFPASLSSSMPTYLTRSFTASLPLIILSSLPPCLSPSLLVSFCRSIHPALFHPPSLHFSPYVCPFLLPTTSLLLSLPCLLPPYVISSLPTSFLPASSIHPIWSHSIVFWQRVRCECSALRRLDTSIMTIVQSWKTVKFYWIWFLFMSTLEILGFNSTFLKLLEKRFSL